MASRNEKIATLPRCCPQKRLFLTLALILAPLPVSSLSWAYTSHYYVVPSAEEEQFLIHNTSTSDQYQYNRACTGDGRLIYRFPLTENNGVYLSLFFSGTAQVRVSRDGKHFENVYIYQPYLISEPHGPDGDIPVLRTFDVSEIVGAGDKFYLEFSCADRQKRRAVPGSILIETGEPRQARMVMQLHQNRARRLRLCSFQIWADTSVPVYTIGQSHMAEEYYRHRKWTPEGIRHWVDEAVQLGCFNAIDLGDDHDTPHGRLFTPVGLNPYYKSVFLEGVRYAHRRGLLVIVEPWNLKLIGDVSSAEHRKICLRWARSFLDPELGKRVPDIVKLGMEPLQLYSNDPYLPRMVENFIEAIREVNPRVLVYIDSIGGFWSKPSMLHFWLMNRYPELIISHYTTASQVPAFQTVGARNMMVQINPNPNESGPGLTGEVSWVEGAFKLLSEALGYRIKYLEVSGQYAYQREIWQGFARFIRPQVDLVHSVDELRSTVERNIPLLNCQRSEVEEFLLRRKRMVSFCVGEPPELFDDTTAMPSNREEPVTIPPQAYDGREALNEPVPATFSVQVSPGISTGWEGKQVESYDIQYRDMRYVHRSWGSTGGGGIVVGTAHHNYLVHRFSVGRGKMARLRLKCAGNIYLKASSDDRHYATLELLPNNNKADNVAERVYDLSPFLRESDEVYVWYGDAMGDSGGYGINVFEAVLEVAANS
jgi:hypothetical protein